MNKYENINLEKSCPLPNWTINKIKHLVESINKVKSKVDYNKSEYLKFRTKKGAFKTFYKPEENDIIIYDNIINRNILENIYKYIFEFDWQVQHSGPEREGFFFSTQVYDNIFFEKMFYDLIIPNIDYVNKEKIKIGRALINYHVPLYPGYWHVDGPGYGPTIVVYINPIWKKEWEGQTAFYTNTKTKEIKLVDIIPGRIVIFKPYIRHRACDISYHSAIEGANRLTLAYQTYYEQTI